MPYEIRRYTIVTDETALDALNRIPGPRFGASWPVLFWLVMVSAVTFPVGGTAEALMLPVTGFGTIYLNRTRMPNRLRVGGWVRSAQWISSVLMLLAAAFD